MYAALICSGFQVDVGVNEIRSFVCV